MSLLQRWAEMTAPVRERFSFRARGAFVLVIGLAVTWWQVALPVLAAHDNRGNAYSSPFLAGLGVVATLFGLFAVLTGSRGEHWLRHRRATQMDVRNLRPRDVGVLLAIAIPLGALMWWIAFLVRS